MNNKEITIRSSAAEYLIFVAATGENPSRVELRYEDENIWLTQRMMAELYGVDVRTINEHIRKIYADNEVSEAATVRNFRIVQTEGSREVSREVKHYSLQMIISIGFKVNNERAVQFRKWANAVVKDYTIQGWVMDDERLKRGGFAQRLADGKHLDRCAPADTKIRRWNPIAAICRRDAGTCSSKPHAGDRSKPYRNRRSSSM